MFKLTRDESDLLIRTLNWILIATLQEQHEKDKTKNIRDKLIIALKTCPEDDVKFDVVKNETD
jgi:hypothetical protein